MVARFFFLLHGGLVEDPATGSACANLGGWLLAHPRREQRAVRWTVRQGAEVGRPSELELAIDADRRITVGGRVREIGSGVVRI
jgi:PhzF family phenazine biosynthesis protein